MFKHAAKTTLFGLFITYSLGCSSATTQGTQKMSTTEKSCDISRFEKSQKIIETILEDLSKSYDQLGGEISDIRLTATNVYQVSISQEERIDLLTYHVEVDETCLVKINKKDVSAKMPWEE